MSLGFAKCGPKKIPFLFSSFIAANQTLKYHGNKTLIAQRVRECGVTVCFLSIHFRSAHLLRFLLC